MRTEAIVARFVEQSLAPIDGARRRVLAAVVWAAMCGRVESLSRLARWMDPLVIAVDWSAVTPGGTFKSTRLNSNRKSVV